MTLGHSQQFDYHAPGRGGIFVEGERGEEKEDTSKQMPINDV